MGTVIAKGKHPKKKVAYFWTELPKKNNNNKKQETKTKLPQFFWNISNTSPPFFQNVKKTNPKLLDSGWTSPPFWTMSNSKQIFSRDAFPNYECEIHTYICLYVYIEREPFKIHPPGFI